MEIIAYCALALAFLQTLALCAIAHALYTIKGAKTFTQKIKGLLEPSASITSPSKNAELHQRVKEMLQ